ncbi:MAG: hypothetical protein M1834_000747 [Cirrosporium novae-zelandiae]|nr:MAG: hypothetical protein M1834_000747 [Cirrosporium novae-zelandiae]
MDICGATFNQKLPLLLDAIAGAHFVAFDLELSGIYKRDDRSGPHRRGKQTLQERYEQTKEAAEKYQILQIGLTCVEEDYERGVYVLRTFNFNVKPLIEENLDIDRTWAFSNSAVQFLIKNNFHLEEPMAYGVGYLSRAEADLARAKLKDRRRNRFHGNVELQDFDTASLQFMDEVRHHITEWLSDPDVEDYLNIPWFDVSNTMPSLTGFQKRLVYQIVHNEFPGLVAAPRWPDWIQITHYDEQVEQQKQERFYQKLDSGIMRQTGLRWLFEAMVGGDLSGIPPEVFDVNMEGDFQNSTIAKEKMLQRLKNKKTTLVGHNLFVDLVNVYKCFFGQLPDRVEGFSVKIHALFPRIIDTKYLATYSNASVNEPSSLETLWDRFKDAEGPIIDMASSHMKYMGSSPLHEAGYDSMLTAKVMIILSYNIDKNGSYSENGDGEPSSFTPNQRVVTEVWVGRSISQSTETVKVPGADSTENKLGSIQPSLTLYPTRGPTWNGRGKRRVKKSSQNPPKPSQPSSNNASSTQSSPVNHPTTFENPRDNTANHVSPNLATFATQNPYHVLQQADSPSKTPNLQPLNLETKVKTGVLIPEILEAEEYSVNERLSPLIPDFDTTFWGMFMNKLRVLGTTEQLLDLEYTPDTPNVVNEKTDRLDKDWGCHLL